MREQAKHLYLKGVSISEIASRLKLLPDTVRKWKLRDDWDKEKSQIVQLKTAKPDEVPEDDAIFKHNSRKELKHMVASLMIEIKEDLAHKTKPLRLDQKIKCMEILFRLYDQFQSFNVDMEEGSIQRTLTALRDLGIDYKKMREN